MREDVRRTGEELGSRLRLLVGKPGLDGHSNGAEQVAVRARDAGFEVVYQGIRLTPEQIVAAAVAEDVHCVGLSILSGSHMELVPAVLDGMREQGLEDVPVVVGGIVPSADAARLKELGVAAVFTPKDFGLTEIMAGILRRDPPRPLAWTEHDPGGAWRTGYRSGQSPDPQENPMSTDAIVLLKADHKEIRKVFTDFEKAGENAARAKGKLVDKMIELLTVHTYIENEVMYPRVRALLPGPRGRRAGVLRGAPRRRPAGRRAGGAEADRRAVHREDHGAHRERPAPHGRGGAGLVPEGPRGPGPQRPCRSSARRCSRPRRRRRASRRSPAP